MKRSATFSTVREKGLPSGIFEVYDEPIRSEIFTTARLEGHAQSLAQAQKVTADPRVGKALAPRIAENRRVLEQSYRELLNAVEENRAITPAAEWLIDNFHIVRTLIKDIHDHLPPQFYKGLPKLSEGFLEGYPRIYGIAWAFVAHTDSRFDPDMLRDFLIAYQKVEPLTIGELWAISITIRVVLIENLRRLTARIVGSQIARREADQLADKILGLGEAPSKPIKVLLQELVGNQALLGSFAVQLLQRLRFQDAAVDPVLEWLERRLRQDNLVADEVVSSEHNSQTAANATVRNIITSSRMMAVFDWQMFFEEVSLVDQILKEQPNYARMDFTSRDRYRHGLEELARYSSLSEIEVARRTLAKTLEAQQRILQHKNVQQSERSCDPGFYLISSGRRAFEKEIAFQPPLLGKITRWTLTHPTPLYIGAIFTLSLLLVLIPALLSYKDNLSPVWLAILCICGFFPASEIAAAVINRFFVALLGPKYLPRLNLEEGIPADAKTFIVVPTMITKLTHIHEQLEQLETHYLSNPDGHVRFALLTDWRDAFIEHTEQDAILLNAAAERLEHLNRKYGKTPDGEDLFYIFHRKRLFNKQEGKWIGWERKRGKLHEFNQLLLGDRTTTHIPVSGPIQVPPNVRYVITLDADTKLPIGSVKQLVGTLAHPLNRARFDEKRRRVVDGYGILQPRITAALPSSQDSTIYQRLSAGPSGVDPYAAAISDIYQDLFGEGSFTGKGIYDLHAFEAALKGRVPENALLSHDLFEGNFARCGFVSDIEFFEDFPSHSGVAAARSHRWTRGDWQLLPWLITRRGAGIPAIGRWKMIDNLRRSLVSPMIFISLVLSMAAPAVGIGAWFALALVGLSISTFVSFASEIFRKSSSVSLSQHLKFVGNDLFSNTGRSVFFLALLPYHAWSSVNAITRALYRLYISHEQLLEWTTADQTKSSASLTIKSFWWSMRGAVGLTAVSAVVISVSNQRDLGFAALFLLLWLASPGIAHLCSSPPLRKPQAPIKPEDIQLMNRSARRIWRFFATFVTAHDSHLPPDNFQEDPLPIVAHRSSPTNFGLYLLAIIAAQDFGWIGLTEMTERLERTLKSLGNLAKYQGHFFNWYDTTDGRPLEPRYISSVDNGNLAGHLLAVSQACLEKLKEPVVITGFNRGTLDSLALIEKHITWIKKTKQSLPPGDYSLNAISELSMAYDDVANTLLIPDHLIENRKKHWVELNKKAEFLWQTAKGLTGIMEGTDINETVAWTRALADDIHSSSRDFQSLVSWSEFANENIADYLGAQNNPSGSVSGAPEILSFWEEIRFALTEEIPLQHLTTHVEKIRLAVLDLTKALEKSAIKVGFFPALLESLDLSHRSATELKTRLIEAYKTCHQLCREMDFGLLYDPGRKLFSIGLRVNDNALDQSYYDLLASESRLTSFIAIAKGDIPVAHWFSLGRALTPVEKGAALISWSGSMFEYLMPSLVMYTPTGSLLEQTCRLAIRKQMSYATAKNVAWGISESAYNKRDLHLTYQYSNFGVPELGLKRGLESDLVIAPYASFLAAMYEPAHAAENLARLEAEGASGPYGFYESIDYTPSRLPENQKSAVIKAYMAHHQGMSLISIANVLKNGIMRKRFHAEPLVQATELLLQERTPRNVLTLKQSSESVHVKVVREISEDVSRRYHSVNRPTPTTELISNGDYTVMLTSSGSGYSRFRDTALTRWREDATKDNWGSFFYLKDLTTQKVWSATFQPVCVRPDKYEVDFAEDRARFTREDNDITSRLEIFVSPENQAEVRRLTLTNSGRSVREIEITSYSEIVLNTQAADVAHPSFSNLFVQTEYVPELNALFATRRARSSSEAPLWMAQVLLTDDHAFGAVEYETDRAEFVGRGRSPRSPRALDRGSNLGGSIGSVLDPVFSLRTKVRLVPGASADLMFSKMVADNREELYNLADKFHDRMTYDRVTNLAWTQAQVKLHYLNIEPAEAHQFQRLATRLLYLDSSLRPSSDILKRNTKDVTGLWAHGISGDQPIILLRIDDIEDRGIVRELIKAQEYLATKRFAVDLVIINEKANSYAQELQLTLESMVHTSMVGTNSAVPQSRGKIFVLRADLLSSGDVDLLYAEARASLSSRLGNLAEQVKRIRVGTADQSPVKQRGTEQSFATSDSLVIPELQFANGIGGFSSEGNEYVIVLKDGQQTPAPWINVIANAQFGFQVSESGSGYTWSMNSRENQLTPWSNDPVCDPSGEALYIRDLDTDRLWTPTPLPIRLPEAVYITSHGQGYSRFELIHEGIQSELTQFVLLDQPCKISHLKLENLTDQRRHLSVASYVEWVLGFSRATMAPTTVTEYDEASGAIFAYNARNTEFGQRIAFACFTVTPQSFTGDRSEFIGRNGALNAPHSLARSGGFMGRVGAGLDPCAALQLKVALAPGEKRTVNFVIGQAGSRDEARELIKKVKAENTRTTLLSVKAEWDELLSAVQVTTPDPAFDLLMNRWLLYQTVVCRIYSRSAFYQAGGAYGFRDQLQDVMAVTVSQPKLAREQIIRAAGRQFNEGDVQHWWHPPTGRGVRTHFSDDLLWLPYVVAHYLKVTGDQSILHVDIPFIEGPLLRPDQEDSYFTPSVSHRSAPIYEHCAMTIERSLKVGTHGLPLMGSGDWNDGMNRVGKEGKGESVWMAWFLLTVLEEFTPIATEMNQTDRVQTWLSHAQKMKTAAELAWDGDWYRRAYFDDGTPLGSSTNLECKIDSLAQTWSVISKGGDPQRALHAMQSLQKYLVRRPEELILLFTPPFDKTPHDPGYIKGYLPGVRENGGQYTHAAAWVVIALAMLGDGKTATEVFSMLNPIRHSLNPTDVQRYKIEPYVLAGDVYSEPPHTGRGGWSWYTGSAGWMYRAGLEYLLGFTVEGNLLRFKPQLSPDWNSAMITYKHGHSIYRIKYERQSAPHLASTLFFDGKQVEGETVPLMDDGVAHSVVMYLKI